MLGKSWWCWQVRKCGRFTCSRRLFVFSRRRSICWLRLHPLSLLHNDWCKRCHFFKTGQCQGVGVCTFPLAAADSNHQLDEMHKTPWWSGTHDKRCTQEVKTSIFPVCVTWWLRCLYLVKFTFMTAATLVVSSEVSPASTCVTEPRAASWERLFLLPRPKTSWELLLLWWATWSNSCTLASCLWGALWELSSRDHMWYSPELPVTGVFFFF